MVSFFLIRTRLPSLLVEEYPPVQTLSNASPTIVVWARSPTPVLSLRMYVQFGSWACKTPVNIKHRLRSIVFFMSVWFLIEQIRKERPYLQVYFFNVLGTGPFSLKIQKTYVCVKRARSSIMELFSGKGLRDLFKLFWASKKRVTKARYAYGVFPQKLEQ